jgi:hypothetical protein
MDFLLSLSVKAKEKLAKFMPDVQNKSVMYTDQTMSEEDVSDGLSYFFWQSLIFIGQMGTGDEKLDC